MQSETPQLVFVGIMGLMIIYAVAPTLVGVGVVCAIVGGAVWIIMETDLLDALQTGSDDEQY